MTDNIMCPRCGQLDKWKDVAVNNSLLSDNQLYKCSSCFYVYSETSSNIFNDLKKNAEHVFDITTHLIISGCLKNEFSSDVEIRNYFSHIEVNLYRQISLVDYKNIHEIYWSNINLNEFDYSYLLKFLETSIIVDLINCFSLRIKRSVMIEYVDKLGYSDLIKQR